MDPMRWYVAQTQPHREAMAEAHLRQQGFGVFLPRRMRSVRHARQIRTVLAPLFPGYVFVRFDPDAVRWRAINGTMGVRRLLAAQDRPIAAPRGVVEGLLAASDAAGRWRPDLQVGDTVRLAAGPFAQALGRIDRLDDAGRVAVLLDIMNAEIRVSLPQDWVQKAAALP